MSTEQEYEYLGSLNYGEKTEKMIHARWEACKTLSHDMDSTHSDRGDHRYFCHTCKYTWSYNSGD